MNEKEEQTWLTAANTKNHLDLLIMTADGFNELSLPITTSVLALVFLKI